ncbi:globin-coupled sensor protein [Pseudooceanicola marinus]|uniref:globin-coupled sensor protein n=1 Tax=Pseudooceanicola marinus TaxID=396013 RepID=UPI001CD4CB9C|nr:globin-coupled sensor protein [Pseudooceanicola marinus]MCA1337654.1 globin-coupled sensor protein [Pseudooceanicola marinus]
MSYDMPALLAQIGLDHDRRRLLSEVGAVLLPHMDAALAGQTELIRAEPALDAMFRDDTHMRQVMTGQVTHWQRLFTGPLDSDFAEQAMKIGRIHFHAGLPVESYFASYARTLSAMQGVLLSSLARFGRLRVAEAVQMIDALSRATMLDQLLAVEGYNTAQREDFGKRLGALSENFQRAIGDVSSGVQSSVTELAGVADGMTRGAAGALPQVEAAVDAAGSTASMILSVSAAAEELSASIKEITSQVTHGQQISADATQKAERTDSLVRTLRSSGDEIGGVVELISDIASQTNLLALNASVEAARAGEAGKGFAVVAGEVKHLSMRISEATTEISAKIDQMQQDMAEAVAAIQDVGGTIHRMAEISASISVSVEQQKMATDDIARNAEATATGTEQMTRNIETVSGVMRQTSEATRSVQTAAEGLKGRSDELRGQIEKFVAGIRAA